MQESPLTPAERELEAALRGLPAARTGCNRDRLLFEAGRASAAAQRRPWQVATGVLSFALAVSIAGIALRSAPSAAPGTYIAGTEPGETRGRTIAEGAHGGPGEYLRIRERVLARGVEALAAPAHILPVQHSQPGEPLRQSAPRAPSLELQEWLDVGERS